MCTDRLSLDEDHGKINLPCLIFEKVFRQNITTLHLERIVILSGGKNDCTNSINVAMQRYNRYKVASYHQIRWRHSRAFFLNADYLIIKPTKTA